MDATQVVLNHGVQYSADGIGRSWKTVDGEYPTPCEELAAWIIEDEPQPGDETRIDGGLYRLPPADAE